MRDELIYMVTIALARCCVMKERGEKVDEATIIADVLLEKRVTVPTIIKDFETI